ncbi:hypothetical protein ABN028_19355 [Actinopolymorpha sp. B17G11]|uniref:hypothetical protein n=1 Tax=Actinopolymorpha sp. B17G11 TaxID=3160861 RepID=UPI0032E38692
MAKPTVPDRIVLERDADENVSLTLDGVPLPWAISADDPIEVRIDRGSAPGVRFTLVACELEVQDRRFPIGSMGEHSPERAASPLEAAAKLAPNHPALRWWPANDAHQHRRSPGGEDTTACGMPGPLFLADATAPRCDNGCWD